MAKPKIVATRVKALLECYGKSRKDVAGVLGLSSEQAVTNKYGRDSFTAQDLIKIADCCGVSLAFVDENGKAVITFPPIEKE